LRWLCLAALGACDIFSSGAGFLISPAVLYQGIAQAVPRMLNNDKKVVSPCFCLT